MPYIRRALGAALLSAAAAVVAKPTPDEAQRLGRELTPLGAEVAASRDGVIPPWNGGLHAPPSCFKGAGGRYCDPYPDDKPLFTITRDNMVQHSGRLSAGQLELFRRFADYQINVYPTRRSFANPEFIYEASRANALKAVISEDDDGVSGAVAGTPFPIPAKGAEIIWNHRLRYRGADSLRWNHQFAVNADGEFSQTRFREETRFIYNHPEAAPEDGASLLGYFLQVTLEPKRLLGSALLLHETLNPAQQERRAWQASPGSRKWRKAPNIGYDTPGTGADGLRSNDQIDSFSGGLDRYNWKLVTKKEMYVPANSWRLHSDGVRYADILRPGHINQDLTRYELRRVWQVDATLAKHSTHQYKKRVFYVDEDGWQIRLVDLYDVADELWRLQEAHTVMAYDQPYEMPVCETVYDLRTGRYLAQALNNEDAETASRQYEASYFEPSKALKRVAK